MQFACDAAPLFILDPQQASGELAQSLLQLSALGHVARNFGEAVELSLGVSQSRNHHARPKARPILADPPIFVFKLACLGCHFQFVGRPVRPDRLLRVKLREVLADDLTGLIPVDALGTGIPGENMPGGIK